MFDYSKMPQQHILCVDMKSFYASCSAVMEGLDPLQCYLVVVGDKEREGSIVLAASPKMKKEFGIKTGSRKFDIPEDPRIVVVEPKMAIYVRVSMEILRVFHRYVPKEAIHAYSVDESFLKVDGAGKLWGDPLTIAKKIKDDIQREFQLTCAIGIGPNLLMAKLCLDLEAKKTGIAQWTYKDIPKKLWPVSPLRDMWGINGILWRLLFIHRIARGPRHGPGLREVQLPTLKNISSPRPLQCGSPSRTQCAEAGPGRSRLSLCQFVSILCSRIASNSQLSLVLRSTRYARWLSLFLKTARLGVGLSEIKSSTPGLD